MGHRFCGKTIQLADVRVASVTGQCGDKTMAMCPGPKGKNRMCVKVGKDQKNLAATLKEKCPIVDIEIIKSNGKHRPGWTYKEFGDGLKIGFTKTANKLPVNRFEVNTKEPCVNPEF